jgi:hypothetical protein
VPVEAGAAEPAASGSVVPLPTRIRPGSGEAPDGIAALVAEAARELQMKDGDGRAEPPETSRRAVASADGPALQVAAEPVVLAEREARRAAASSPAEGARPGSDENSETRFFQALAEIRALKKRAAAQAGE